MPIGYILYLSMTQQLETRIVEKALEHLADTSWAEFRFAALADTGLPLAEIMAVFPTKEALLKGINHYVDAKMGQSIKEGIDDSILQDPIKDRLFEIFMSRLDVLQAHRHAFLHIQAHFKTHPTQAGAHLCQAQKSMGQILHLAGLDQTPPLGLLKQKALLGVYVYVLQTWRHDTSPDLSKTMAELDKALTWLERTANLFFAPAKRKDL